MSQYSEDESKILSIIEEITNNPIFDEIKTLEVSTFNDFKFKLISDDGLYIVLYIDETIYTVNNLVAELRSLYGGVTVYSHSGTLLRI